MKQALCGAVLLLTACGFPAGPAVEPEPSAPPLAPEASAPVVASRFSGAITEAADSNVDADAFVASAFSGVFAPGHDSVALLFGGRSARAQHRLLAFNLPGAIRLEAGKAYALSPDTTAGHLSLFYGETDDPGAPQSGYAWFSQSGTLTVEAVGPTSFAFRLTDVVMAPPEDHPSARGRFKLEGSGSIAGA